MKTITMDFEIYQAEIRDAELNKRKEIQNFVVEFLLSKENILDFFEVDDYIKLRSIIPLRDCDFFVSILTILNRNEEAKLLYKALNPDYS